MVKCLTENDEAVSRCVEISTNLFDGTFKPVLRILVACQINTYIFLNPTPDFIKPAVCFKLQIVGFQPLIEKYVYLLLTMLSFIGFQKLL